MTLSFSLIHSFILILILIKNSISQSVFDERIVFLSLSFSPHLTLPTPYPNTPTHTPDFILDTFFSRRPCQPFLIIILFAEKSEDLYCSVLLVLGRKSLARTSRSQMKQQWQSLLFFFFAFSFLCLCFTTSVVQHTRSVSKTVSLKDIFTLFCTLFYSTLSLKFTDLRTLSLVLPNTLSQTQTSTLFFATTQKNY